MLPCNYVGASVQDADGYQLDTVFDLMGTLPSYHIQPFLADDTATEKPAAQYNDEDNVGSEVIFPESEESEELNSDSAGSEESVNFK